jgi:hypothetical protein
MSDLLMPNVPDNALALGGFTLAHATWSVSDLPDSELLVPMAIFERGGQRELLRFEAETQEEAIVEGKRVVAEENDADAWAFAREGAMRTQADGEAQDALVVDIWGRGMLNPLTIIQPFERYTKHGRFRVIGEMIFASSGQLVDSTSAEKVIEGIKEGIQQHSEVAELWHTWL